MPDPQNLTCIKLRKETGALLLTETRRRRKVITPSSEDALEEEKGNGTDCGCAVPVLHGTGDRGLVDDKQAGAARYGSPCWLLLMCLLPIRSESWTR